MFIIRQAACTKETIYTFLSAFNNVLKISEKLYCINKFMDIISVNEKI